MTDHDAPLPAACHTGGSDDFTAWRALLLLGSLPLRDTSEGPSLEPRGPAARPRACRSAGELLLLPGATLRGWPASAPTVGGPDWPLTVPALNTPRAAAPGPVASWSPDAIRRGGSLLLRSEAAAAFTHRHRAVGRAGPGEAGPGG